MLVARTVQACLPIFLVAFCLPLHAGVLTALSIDQINYTPPEDAAKQDIERWKKEDAMYETAKQLVDFAVKAHMEMFGAKYWINRRGTEERVMRMGAKRRQVQCSSCLFKWKS